MKPKTTQIQETRPSDWERVFTIPHAFQISVITEAIYVFGISWMLFIAYLFGNTDNGLVVALLGALAALGTVLLGRALWTCFADGVLTLRADEVIWERNWKQWKSTGRVATAEIDHIHIVESRWASSKNKTVQGVEIKASRRRIRFGWHLNWEERNWLSQEIKEFLAPFSPPLRETIALEEATEESGEHKNKAQWLRSRL